MALRLLAKFLTAVLALAFSVGTAAGQSVGAPRTVFMGSQQDRLLTQLRVYGGILYDFQNNNFYAGPAPNPTRYADCQALFSALGATVTSSAKKSFNAQGILVDFPANTIACPTYTGAGQIRGIAFESAATNTLVRSNDFAQAAWTKTNVTLAANNRVAPTGLTEASTITEDGSTGNHWLIQSVTKSAAVRTYTATCYVAASTGSRGVVVYADDGTGVNGAYAIFPIDGSLSPAATAFGTFTLPASSPNTWATQAGSLGFVRLGFTYSTNSTTTVRFACGMADGTNYSYQGDGTSSIVLYGAQNEQNTTGATQTATAPSSYITTAAAAVSRPVDNIQVALPVFMQGASAYSAVLNLQLARAANGLQNTFLSLADSTDTNYLALLQDSPSVQYPTAIRVESGGVATPVRNAGPLNLFDQNFGIAAAMKGGDYWIENSGQSIKTSTAAAYPATSITTLRIGSYDASANQFSGNIGLIQTAIFPTRVPNTTLQSMLFETPPYNPDLNVPPNYFTQAMINSIDPAGTQVFRSARMPTSDAETNATYTSYPLTIAYSLDINRANTQSTATLTKFAWLPWANRCDLCIDAVTNAKPNNPGGPQFSDSSGRQARVRFSTYDLSDAATLSLYLYGMGYSAHQTVGCPASLNPCGYLDVTAAAGIPDAHVITYQTASATPDTYFPNIVAIAGVNYATVTDWVILPNGVVGTGTSATWGVLCDCEWGDNRTASRTSSMLTTMTDIVHTKGYLHALAIDDLLGSGIAAGFCGVGVSNVKNGVEKCDIPGGNLAAIVGVVDFFAFSSISQPPPRSYTFEAGIAARIALFGPAAGYDHSKIMAQFNLGSWPGGTTVANAVFARSTFLSEGWGAWQIVPVSTTMGGAETRCTNQKQEILLFGTTASPITAGC